MKFNDCQSPCHPGEETQRHVHEVVGSVRLAELDEDPHNHRFAGVTGEAILVPGGSPGEHFHMLKTTTDFYENHFHPICVKTGVNVSVGEGDDERHVHFIDYVTKVADEHFHEFIAATLIQDPTGD